MEEESRNHTHPVFDTASLHLVGEDLGTALLGLGLVDVLHQHALVLEDVTLRLLIEDMVPVNHLNSARTKGGKSEFLLTNACRSFQPLCIS